MTRRQSADVPTTIEGWLQRAAELQEQVNSARAAISAGSPRRAELAAKAFAHGDPAAEAELAKLAENQIAHQARCEHLGLAISHCNEQIAALQKVQERIDTEDRTRATQTTMREALGHAVRVDELMSELAEELAAYRTGIGVLANTAGVRVPSQALSINGFRCAAKSAGLAEFLDLDRHLHGDALAGSAARLFDRPLRAIRIWSDGHMEFESEQSK